MKVLWLCSAMLPAFAERFGEKASPFGGWLTGLFSTIREQMEIVVCCPCSTVGDLDFAEIDGTLVYAFREKSDITDAMKRVLRESNPDVIHIWGTEEKQSLDMINAANALGLGDRVVINIQGLVSVIAKYHYFAGLPQKIIQSRSPSEMRHHIGLRDRQREMAERGEYEIEAIRKAPYVIGRTEWDEACTTQIHPNVRYFKCNETLRESFYNNRWEIDSCERHSIFVSQSSYPLKGFHIMLEAMPLILARFPDAKLCTTGFQPKVPKTFKEKFAREAYPAYLAERIRDLSLEGRVSFLGRLDEERMCRQYLRSHVFVSPSSIENSSNSIGEAMLLGMPVVSSDVGGVKDFIDHRKEGYLYPSDAPYMLAYYVCKIFEDDDRAVRMGESAHTRACASYDRERNVAQTMRIYREISQNQPRG